MKKRAFIIFITTDMDEHPEEYKVNMEEHIKEFENTEMESVIQELIDMSCIGQDFSTVSLVKEIK